MVAAAAAAVAAQLAANLDSSTTLNVPIPRSSHRAALCLSPPPCWYACLQRALEYEVGLLEERLEMEREKLVSDLRKLASLYEQARMR